MGTIEDAPQYILIREAYPYSGGIEMDLSEFLSELEKFTSEVKSDASIIRVAAGRDGFTFYETRLETMEEFSARRRAKEEHLYKVQAQKDKSWARQKARFARARSKAK